MVHITDAITQTIIFGVLFLVTLLFSIRQRLGETILPPTLTQELKGFSILAIVLAHIGYFLSDNSQFLFPFSILSGAGVNLFLFLSGLGLTFSNLKQNYHPLKFYRRRLQNLIWPLWISLLALIILDYLLFRKVYPFDEIWKSFLGFFQNANPTYNINSPLWFITMILFYYLVFPIFWIKKYPFISSFLVLIVGLIVTHLTIPVSADNLYLYQIHILAFPLGMLVAYLLSINPLKSTSLKAIPNLFRWLLIIPLCLLFSYFAYYSNVGAGIVPEQLTSLLIMTLLILVFILKDFNFKFFSIVGVFSYEVYLIHWPILSRYDFLFKFLPAGLATFLYLGFFLIIAWLLQKLDGKISQLIHF